MAVIDLYSKRKKSELKAGQPDVYHYDSVPNPLRVQVIHIWRDSVGTNEKYDEDTNRRWTFIHDTMAREKGLIALHWNGNCRQKCEQWFLESKQSDDALDMIELTFRLIERVLGDYDNDRRRMHELKISAREAIEELNQRFREHDLGYQYENGTILRMDSQYVHAEVIKPTLALLAAEPFLNANEDFMTAHKHYRAGEHKDCVVAAQRAFESTLKAICSTKGWTFAKGDRAGELITAVRSHGLFPTYLDRAFDTYVAMLKTGLPDVRNSAGGHGDEPNATPVPSYIAAYALHLTAANIVLAVRAFQGVV